MATIKQIKVIYPAHTAQKIPASALSILTGSTTLLLHNLSLIGKKIGEKWYILASFYDKVYASLWLVAKYSNVVSCSLNEFELL